MLLSFSAIRKDVVDVLDFMEMLKNEEDQKVGVVNLIEKLQLELAFICTYVQLPHSVLEEFEDIMTGKRQEVENLFRSILCDVEPNVGIKYDIHHVVTCLRDNLDYFISSQHHSKSSATMTDEQLNFLFLNLQHLSKYEILQNVCGNIKEFHGLIMNGCVEHEIIEYVLPQFQRMAERVGHFLWDELISDQDSRVVKLAHLYLKIIPIELEVMHICFTNLKGSTSAAVELFIEKLLEIIPDILKRISDSSSRAHDFIHHDKLFDLLAHVGELTRKVSTLVQDLEEKSRKHLNDLFDSNAYSIALIKEEIELVKEDLKFLRSFLIGVEQELYKDLWTRVLDVAYEAKDVIDSIIVPKNRGLIVVNSPEKSVERNSLTAGKIIVGFEEETNMIIKKLTSGLADLDVISITGIPGSGKTTLAYKVYNDKLVSSHFDIRVWCTVGHEYDEKKLLHKVLNQVTGPDLKFSEDTDVADMLRRQLFGKRYLIVLDDVWDNTTWDELTRPFPEFEKRSRIILTTQEKKVALHGKCNTDPLNLRLLRPEESWELLEKRAFGKESCPDELFDVGKEIAENCKELPLVADLIAGVIAGLEKKKTVA
ncbi:putative late blight resistance protein homolog R1A-10 [Solanum stenotomum]|uniref:putative late blight resistance protein homolog R1A-10 n=1 Tax=Solanum stenotomum TaxID=172797 RepID=UPI0020D14B76|nr:putative late blight resistance protein homolog R1A-10 [Solanum stenotomum]